MQRLTLEPKELQQWLQNKPVSTAFLHQLEMLIKEAVSCLESGGTLIYPTETTYGIGVDAENQEAVDRLLRYKGRREGKPLSIAVTDQKMASRYVKINDQAEIFYQRFLPGPYTVVSQGKQRVAKGVESEFQTLGIRIPAYRLVTEIVKSFGRGITSTSANISDQRRPYQIADILETTSPQQQQLIDCILDVGKLAKNEPSLVIDTTLETPLVMRGQQKQVATLGTFAEDFNSRSVADTEALASRLLLKYWNRLGQKGLLFGLNGPLGMGKSVFARGLGRALGIAQAMPSPTYSYMNEYPYEKNAKVGKFYHVDAWKIDRVEEAQFLELEKLLAPNQIIVVEWWQQIAQFLPQELSRQAILLDFSARQENPEFRKIHIQEAKE
jgi:L-threonylcarbamoyladenylate synthase